MKFVNIVILSGIFLASTAQAFDAVGNCPLVGGRSGVRECLLNNVNGNSPPDILAWHLYLPPNWAPTSAKFPTLIWVHGGGWAKVFSTEFVRNNIEQSEKKFLLDMASKGFIVAAPDYNSVDYDPVFPYSSTTPDSLYDLKVKADYIGRPKFPSGGPPYYGLADVADFADAGFNAAIAEDLRIDTSNISIGGDSAGGYMTLYEATRGANNYNCVIAASAPSNLEKYISSTTNPPINYDMDFLHGIGIINTVFCLGCTADFKARLAAINPGNPARLANLKAKKLFVTHSVYDNFVPVSQSIDLAKLVRSKFAAISVKEWYERYPRPYPRNCGGNNPPENCVTNDYPRDFRETSPRPYNMPKKGSHAIDPVVAYAKLQEWMDDCKTTANPQPVPICGKLRDTCEAGVFKKGGSNAIHANWQCGTEICEAPFPVMTFAESGASLAGWPASSVIDGNPNTVWSSPASDRFNSQRNSIIAWIDKNAWNNPTIDIKAPSVFEVVMKARMLNGRPLAFPKSYNISTTDWLGTRVKSLGNYSTQPDANGNVVIPIPNAPIQVLGVKIEPTELGVDDYNNYYFQLAELAIR